MSVEKEINYIDQPPLKSSDLGKDIVTQIIQIFRTNKIFSTIKRGGNISPELDSGSRDKSIIAEDKYKLNFAKNTQIQYHKIDSYNIYTDDSYGFDHTRNYKIQFNEHGKSTIFLFDDTHELVKEVGTLPSSLTSLISIKEYLASPPSLKKIKFKNKVTINHDGSNVITYNNIPDEATGE